MAFPLIALLTAGASDLQSNAEEETARLRMAADAKQRILRTRAQELGGSPYGMMAQDYENSLAEFEREAESRRNNNIGALLQAYLKSNTGSSGAESYGDPYAKQLAANPGEGGFGMGNVMGKAQLDPWDKDPWGDAGF